MKNSIVFTVVAAIAFALTTTAHAQVIMNRGGVPVQGNYQYQQQRGVPVYRQGTQQVRSVPQPTSVDLPPMSEADLEKTEIGATFYDAANSLRVGSVFTNSPAKTAGLRTGDFVTKMNGKPLTSAAQFKAAINAMAPGSKIKLTHKRGAKEREVEATLAKMVDIVNASIVPEPGTYDGAMQQATREIATLKQKIVNTKEDLSDLNKMLAGQEKRLADLKTKADADRKKMEAAKAKK